MRQLKDPEVYAECEIVEYEITEKHVRILESMIREQPEYWIWSHRRWKHKKKPEKNPCPA